MMSSVNRKVYSINFDIFQQVIHIYWDKKMVDSHMFRRD